MKAILRFKPLDIVAFLAALAVLIGVSAASYGGGAASLTVEISAADGTLLYRFGEERIVEVEGPLGSTRIVLQEDGVRIASSPCPDKLCIHMGAIRKPGQWIACLPNQVFVRILGREKESLDAQSY